MGSFAHSLIHSSGSSGSAAAPFQHRAGIRGNESHQTWFRLRETSGLPVGEGPATSRDLAPTAAQRPQRAAPLSPLWAGGIPWALGASRQQMWRSAEGRGLVWPAVAGELRPGTALLGKPGRGGAQWPGGGSAGGGCSGSSRPGSRQAFCSEPEAELCPENPREPPKGSAS